MKKSTLAMLLIFLLLLAGVAAYILKSQFYGI